MNVSNYRDSSKNHDVISLFSGAMGLDLGLKKSGLNIKIGQDFDSSCISTMRTNGHNALEGDIRGIQPEQILEITNLYPGEPFLICGGSPCQPFSTAGKRLGINDPRGSLFMDFIRMIDYIRPRFFIMENVKGIMSSPLKSLSEVNEVSGTVLDVVLSDLINWGIKQFLVY